MTMSATNLDDFGGFDDLDEGPGIGIIDGWEELAADPDLIVDWDMGPPSDLPDIRGLDDADAAEKMAAWFLTNFENPVHNTPWDGEYVYIRGGPYDAREELEDAFGGQATEPAIEVAAKQIEEEDDSWEAASRMQPEEPRSALIAAKRRLMDVLRAWRKEPHSDYAAFDVRDVATLLHACRQPTA
jgi:hypothetical protein